MRKIFTNVDGTTPEPTCAEMVKNLKAHCATMRANSQNRCNLEKELLKEGCGKKCLGKKLNLIKGLLIRIANKQKIINNPNSTPKQKDDAANSIEGANFAIALADIPNKIRGEVEAIGNLDQARRDLEETRQDMLADFAEMGCDKPEIKISVKCRDK
jgi:hypothetical protein